MKRRLATLLVLAAVLATLGCRSAPLFTSKGGEVVFVGNESFSREELIEEGELTLADLERSGWRKPFADDAAYLLESFYRGAGFPFAVVDYVYEPSYEGATVTFEIAEGPRVRLDEVTFTGNDRVSTETLRRFVETADIPEDSRLLDEDVRYYSRPAVEGVARRVQAYYRASGYLDARVRVADEEFDPSRGSVRVGIEVEEGVRYHVEDVSFEGELVLDEASLRRALGRLDRPPYTPRLGADLANRLLGHYRENGFPDVEVSTDRTVDAVTGAVRLVLRVRPGTRVVVSEVRIEGAEGTSRKFIRSRLEIEAGERYDAEAERESFRRLFDTGLFESVSIELEGDGPERPLVVRLDPAPTKEVFVEPGFGSYELARLRVGYVERNLFGTGRQLRTTVKAAMRELAAKVGVTDPWFLGEELVADVTLETRRREEPSFTFADYGIGLSLGKRLSRSFNASVGYRFRRSDLLEIEVFDEDVEEALQDVDISSVFVRPEYDTRDSFLVPREGSYGEALVELASSAIGSEIDFVRSRLAWSRYLEATEGTVLAAGVRTGVIVPLGATEVIPLQERFFNGGATTVRSFAESELGPLDEEGEPIGGEAFSVASLEVRQRVVGRFEAAAFVDAGNVVLDVNEYFDFDDVAWAVGGGLRYVLPIGPLRLDVGWNPDPGPDDADYAIHFSIGMPF